MFNVRFSLPKTILLATVVLAGCRGSISERPPIHINPNMDWQERFDPQESIDRAVFADGRAMRPPVEGTVARGFLKEDVAFHEGRDVSGAFVAANVVPITDQLLVRGQERYEIFCTPCHGGAGDGRGIIMVGNDGAGYGYVPAPTFHQDRLRQVEDGYLYSVVKNGIRNMPGYAQQIPVADRWAIVAYVRALQLSQAATAAEAAL